MTNNILVSLWTASAKIFISKNLLVINYQNYVVNSYTTLASLNLFRKYAKFI